MDAASRSGSLTSMRTSANKDWAPGTNELWDINGRLLLGFDGNQRLTSWDDSGDSGHPHSWLLEAGKYRLFAGNGVRDLLPVCFAGREELIVPSVQVFSRHEQALELSVAFSRLRPGRHQKGGRLEEWDDAPRSIVSLRERILSRLPPAQPLTGNQGIHLSDVVQSLLSGDLSGPAFRGRNGLPGGRRGYV